MRFCPECGERLAPDHEAVQQTQDPASVFTSDPPPHGQLAQESTPPPLTAVESAIPILQNAAQRNIVGGNQSISYEQSSHVYYQDESKSVRTCAISGRQAPVVAGNVCPVCERWVHSDFFDPQQRKCCDCEQKHSAKSRAKFGELLNQHLNDGLITETEFAELRELGNSLGIPVAEQNSLISAARKSKTLEGKPLSLLESTKLSVVLNKLAQVEILDCESANQILADLRVLTKSHPEDEKITSLFLLATAQFLSKTNLDILDKAKEIIQTSPAFIGDTARKYFIFSLFARILIVRRSSTREAMAKLRPDVLKLLENTDNDQRTRVRSQIESLCPFEADEELDHIFAESVAALEQHFPLSTECLAVRTMILLDHGWQSDSPINTVQEVRSLAQHSSLDAERSDLDFCLERLFSWLGQIDSIKQPQSLHAPQRPMVQIYYNACYGINRFSILENVHQRLRFLLDTPSGGVLNEEIAKQFLDYGLIDTSKFSHITDEAAAMLGAAHMPLNLDGLTSLSIASAMALRAVCGRLSLNGLRVISDEVAFGISQVEAELELNHLVTISETGLLIMFYFRSRLSERGLIETYFFMASFDVTKLSMEFRKLARHTILLNIECSDIGIREPDTGWRIWLDGADNTDYDEDQAMEIKLRTFWKSLSDPRYAAMPASGVQIGSPYSSLTDADVRRRFPQLYPAPIKLQTAATVVPQNAGNPAGIRPVIPQAGLARRGPPPLPATASTRTQPPIFVERGSASLDNLQNRFSKLLASFSASKRVYVTPKIPKQKLFGAHMTFLPKDEEVLVLVDNSALGATPLGLCQEGFAITRKRICGRGVTGGNVSIPIGDIQTIGYNEPDVWINGKVFVELSMLKEDEIGRILETIQVAVDSLKQ